MEEEPNGEGNEPIYDEELEDIIQEGSYKSNEGENLIIQHIMTIEEDDEWLRNNIFRIYYLSYGKKCLPMIYVV